MKKLIVFAIAILGFTAVSFGQAGTTSDNATASASATILAPIAISKTTDLSFGVVGASSSAATTVILSTTGGRTGTATPFTIGAAASAAEFAITGTPNANFSVTLPQAVVSLTGPATSTAMTINVADWVSSIGTSNIALSASGTKTLNVGTTLRVGQSQLAGNYSGSFDVTVAYE